MLSGENCSRSVVREHVAPQVVSSDPAVIEQTYNDALSAGHEGLMLKVPASPYTPGQRGKNWIKIKPEVDTLDLAVIGAVWGEGKRAHVFGSFLMACQDQGKLIPLSWVATGFSDDQLAEVYDLLKDKVISKSKNEVRFEPGLVFEVGYAELQASQTYEGGFALRFPRFIRIRDDKDIPEIETIESIRDRYMSAVKIRTGLPDLKQGPLGAHLRNKGACRQPVVKPDECGGGLGCLFQRRTGYRRGCHRSPCRLPDDPGPQRRPVIAGDMADDDHPG